MKRLKLGSVAALLGLLSLPAIAAWDRTKPEASSPTRQSSEIRANWAAIEQGIGGVNLVADNTFLLWAAGDAASPTMYTFSGAGGAVARTGDGLADTVRKYGPFAVRVTSAATNATLSQYLVSGDTGWDKGFRSLDAACGAWVNTSTAGAARICVQDDSGQQGCSNAHTGNGTWQWLTGIVQVEPDSIGGLQWLFNVDATSVVAYVSGPTCVIGSVPPSYPQPSGWENFAVDCFRASAQTTGTDKVDCHWQSPYYGIVQDVSLWAGTAPVGAALIVSVGNWDGAAYTGLHGAAARPRIADGATRSDAAPPNSAYARAIIVPQHGTTQAVGGELAIGIDQIGSGTAGSDLRIQIRGIRAARPLQQFLLATE